MILLNNNQINVTKFPDNTSQVWNIGNNLSSNHINKIQWNFEDESELFHLIQLITLIKKLDPISTNDLHIPFLPYSRQDKVISDQTTFALTPFVSVIESLGFDIVSTVDVHNPNSIPKHWRNIIPVNRIREVIEKVQPHLICFPDEGAANRGYPTNNVSSFSLEKKRCQFTGSIESLKLSRPVNVKSRSILIIDDLCDRGGTFIRAAELLNNLGASVISLYTTHGIYSGGKDLILDGGIDRLFNLTEEIW